MVYGHALGEPRLETLQNRSHGSCRFGMGLECPDQLRAHLDVDRGYEDVVVDGGAGAQVAKQLAGQLEVAVKLAGRPLSACRVLHLLGSVHHGEEPMTKGNDVGKQRLALGIPQPVEVHGQVGRASQKLSPDLRR